MLCYFFGEKRALLLIFTLFASLADLVNYGPYFTYVLKELRIMRAINVVFKTSTIHTILTCAKETAYNEVNQCNVVFKTSSGIRKK